MMNIINNILGRDRWSKDDAASDALARGAAFGASQQQIPQVTGPGPRIAQVPLEQPKIVSGPIQTYTNPSYVVNSAKQGYQGGLFKQQLKDSNLFNVNRLSENSSSIPRNISVYERRQELRDDFVKSAPPQQLANFMRQNPNSWDNISAHQNIMKQNVSREQFYNMLNRPSYNVPFEQRTLTRDQAQKIYGSKLRI